MRILFISHEMSLTGAPRSLLRMCRAARRLGHVPTVWTMRPGPLEAEFAGEGISVETVPIEETAWPERLKEIESYDLAVCNTAVTARFVRVCCQRVPTVWYIREAANIADVLAASPPETAYMLRHSRDTVCVSEYAARALRPYTGRPVRVLRNAVEDEADKLSVHVPGADAKLRFIQLGALERRKGCDMLLEAYRALSPELRSRCELYFAGPGAESEFGAALLRTLADTPGTRYLGVLEGLDRLRALARMDVAVTASRDEACGLAVLEGAMLGKPLIVTENVGAKYMVGSRNGLVVRPGDAEALRAALERCLREKERLSAMGIESRRRYETLAGMENYTRELGGLFAKAEKKDSWAFRRERRRNERLFREEEE